MAWYSGVARLFGFGSALSDSNGPQLSQPTARLVEDTPAASIDAALQLSTVWACVSVLAKTIAMLPVFVYETSADGKGRNVARDNTLWKLLHESPNSRMTPSEFWTALILNLVFKGNAYARIDRDSRGEAFAMWPMAADQVALEILPDGSSVYKYRIGNDVAVLADVNVLHLKDIGNGTTGMSRIDYMRATVGEAGNSQRAANRLFKDGGKPSGVLMIDKVLTEEQRVAIKQNLLDMAEGNSSKLFVLEANTKYQQITVTPEDMQLLETRQYTVEEICRWFSVPAVLVNHANVSTWGSGIEQILEGFYKLVIRPMLVSAEQSIRKRVMTPEQRAQYVVEFELAALLRSNIKDRMEIYSKAVQNGLKTRNECRQLENDPPIAGGDELTAQVNLMPLSKLGQGDINDTGI